jgi:hypothetical protein
VVRKSSEIIMTCSALKVRRKMSPPFQALRISQAANQREEVNKENKFLVWLIP